jgi:GH43 family beta-xylosidase
MSTPYTVSGSFRTISTPTLSWQRQGGTVNEGPEILQRGGKTFLVYSASGCWTPACELGQLTLTGSDPLSASSWTNGRTTRAQKFPWNADGSPDFGSPVAFGASAAGPSGEPSGVLRTYTLTDRNSGKCLEWPVVRRATGPTSGSGRG